MVYRITTISIDSKVHTIKPPARDVPYETRSLKPMKEVLLKEYVNYSTIAEVDLVVRKMASVTEMANLVPTCIPNMR